jgi:hypothetical protein
VTESIALPRRLKAVDMPNTNKFTIREWLVPPILLPIFFVLLVAAVMLIRWAPRQGPARVVPLGALMLANFCYVAC